MAYDEKLAARVRSALGEDSAITEKKMFGGIAFLHRGRMLVGIVEDTLIARVGPHRHAEALERQHVRPMDFTGRPMKGYVFVDAPGIRTGAQLRFWLERCLELVRTLPEK